MRKSVIILTVLLALTMLIGVDWMRGGLSLSDSHSPRPSKSEDLGKPAIQMSLGRVPRYETSLTSNHEEASREITRKPVRPVKTNLNKINGLGGRKKFTQTYFIRSSLILRTQKPTEEEIERLVHSVRQVAETFEQHVFVIDADGKSTHEVPVLLYARSSFDLTESVKRVYISLDSDAGSHSEITKVEQVVPPKSDRAGG